MFHMHLQGTGGERYWDLPEDRKEQIELMGYWFLQLKGFVQLAIIFYPYSPYSVCYQQPRYGI
jgi:hypothetical protein